MSVADVLDGRTGWHLIEGDCLSPDVGLPSLPDGCAQHVITDPPYDERTHSRARSLKDGGSDIPIDFDPLANMDHVGAMLHAASRWSIAFCAVEDLGAYRDAAGAGWVRGGMWFRTDGTPQISSDRPAQGAEGIAVMHRPGVKLRWNSGGKRGVWVCGVERDNRQHPTQKPITLMESLIADFTDPGDLILDPFSGSGTTGVAAIRLGRRFIGWERDPKHAGTARKRLSAAREQLGLFTGAKVKAPKPLMLALGDK